MLSYLHCKPVPRVQGQLYDLKGRGTNPGPAFSPVTAVPGTAEGGGGGVARVSVEGEEETDRGGGSQILRGFGRRESGKEGRYEERKREWISVN